jgi:hypothetical protein
MNRLFFVALVATMNLIACKKESSSASLDSETNSNAIAETSFLEKINYQKFTWAWNDTWAFNLQGKKIVLIGNSLAQNITWPEFNTTYGQYNVIPRGVAGSTLANWKPQHIGAMVTIHNPDQILIYGGLENEYDSAYNKTPSLKGVAYYMIPAMRSTYLELRKQNPTATITVISAQTPPRFFTYGYEFEGIDSLGKYGTPGKYVKYSDIDYLNVLWKRLISEDTTKGNKATYIELKSVMQRYNPRRAYPELYHPDEPLTLKLHNGRSGYQVWASRIIPGLVK